MILKDLQRNYEMEEFSNFLKMKKIIEIFATQNRIFRVFMSVLTQKVFFFFVFSKKHLIFFSGMSMIEKSKKVLESINSEVFLVCDGKNVKI